MSAERAARVTPHRLAKRAATAVLATGERGNGNRAARVAYAAARERGETVSLAHYRARLETHAAAILEDVDPWGADALEIDRDALEAYRVDLEAYALTTAGWPRGPLEIPPGASAVVHVYRDDDSSPDDVDCLEPADVEAWRADRWQYVGHVVRVILCDGTTGEASLWGSEHGDYWHGSDRAQSWDIVGPSSDLIAEALADALEHAPDVSRVISPMLPIGGAA